MCAKIFAGVAARRASWTAEGVVSTDAKLVLAATPKAAPSAAPVRTIARAQAGERPLAATALATCPLATDRSGTVASGTTEQLLLVVKPANQDKSGSGGWQRPGWSVSASMALRESAPILKPGWLC
jgi:hypothetical protein